MLRMEASFQISKWLLKSLAARVSSVLPNPLFHRLQDGRHSSKYESLELYLRRNLKHNVRSPLPNPLFQ